MKIYWLIAVAVFVLYLILYFYFIGYLIFTASENFTFQWLPNWQDLIWRQRSPLLFESVAIFQTPLFTLFISIPNLIIGIILSLLVAANIIVSIYSFQALGLRGVRGLGILVGTVPALLSGAACCAPLLIVFLGIQLSAGLLGVFAFLVPLAIILLLASLLWSLSRIRSGKF